jgi:hypothetical protein
MRKNLIKIVILSICIIFSLISVSACSGNGIGKNLTKAPSAEDVQDAISIINTITDTAITTKDNDSNNIIKDGGIGAVFFVDSNVPTDTIPMADDEALDPIEIGTVGGGSIEIWKTKSDANKRNNYLTALDGPGLLNPGSHTVVGTLVIRTSSELSTDQQKVLEQNIIDALHGKYKPSNDSQTTAEKSVYLPLEVKEYGYSISDGMLYYAIIIHNPNTDYVTNGQEYRLTAYDENEKLIFSEEGSVYGLVRPNQDVVASGSVFDVDIVPANIELELLDVDEYDVSAMATLEHPIYSPLIIENLVAKVLNAKTRYLGKIVNSNDYKIDYAKVILTYRDSNNKLTGYTASTSVDQLAANGELPLDFSEYEGVTDKYDIYAYAE